MPGDPQPTPDRDRIPGREHYRAEYLRNGRTFSFAHQIHETLIANPRTVLEIGVGPGLVSAALRVSGCEVTTVDVEDSLGPDVVASVLDLPFAPGHFDAGLCCQVLEHLPYDSFGPAVKELLRVCRTRLILSLPDVSRLAEISLRAPVLGRRRFQIEVPRVRPKAIPPARYEQMGHYWEIGYKGYPPSRIAGAIAQAGGRVRRQWRVSELPWHRFYIIEPSSTGS